MNQGGLQIFSRIFKMPVNIIGVALKFCSFYHPLCRYRDGTGAVSYTHLVFVADRIREQIDPDESFAAGIIMDSDLDDIRYLYQFGEYISENELQTTRHLMKLDDAVIKRMADVYTEGYRIGFVNTGKDLSKKSTVNIRYVLGFERVIKKAIANFEKMGLKPVIYRSGVSVLTKIPNL